MSVYLDFWTALNARDWDGFGRCVIDEVTAEWPQSRERLRGRAALIRFMSAYPGGWTLAVDIEHADSTGAATRIAFTQDGETVSGLTFFTASPDGRIAGFVEYWPEPYEPPAGRGDLVERY